MENYLILEKDGRTKFFPYNRICKEIEILGFCDGDIRDPNTIPKVRIEIWIEFNKGQKLVRLIAGLGGITIDRGHSIEFGANSVWGINDIMLSEKDKKFLEEFITYYVTNYAPI